MSHRRPRLCSDLRCSPRLSVSRGELLFFRSRAISAITAIHYPTRPFPLFVANKGASANRPLGLPGVTLGWPRRGPGVTLGSPSPRSNPNPRVGRGSQFPSKLVVWR
jgi:hypothetical protein